MFNNTVGKAANVVTGGASQNVGNILGGKGNLGDLLNIGLGIGTGGLSGLGNIGKMQTGDFLQFLPMLFGGQGGQGQQGFNLPSNLSDLAGQLSTADLASLLLRIPQRNQALDRAFNSLSPAGTRATANSLGNQAQARATEAGNANAGTLQRQGYASSVQDAAKLQGRNSGASQANSLLAAIMGPQAQGQNALLQSQIYSPSNLQGGGLNSLLALQGATNNQRQANVNYENTRPETWLETMLGIAPTIASAYMGQNRPAQGGHMGGSSVIGSSVIPSQGGSAPQLKAPSFQQGVAGATSVYNPPANYGVTTPKGWFDKKYGN